MGGGSACGRGSVASGAGGGECKEAGFAICTKEPKEGFEPSTPALRKRCSAIELLRRYESARIAAINGGLQGSFRLGGCSDRERAEALF